MQADCARNRVCLDGYFELSRPFQRNRRFGHAAMGHLHNGAFQPFLWIGEDELDRGAIGNRMAIVIHDHTGAQPQFVANIKPGRLQRRLTLLKRLWRWLTLLRRPANVVVERDGLLRIWRCPG